MKRMLSLALALVMLAALFTGCGCMDNTVSEHPGGIITDPTTMPTVLPTPTATHRPEESTMPGSTGGGTGSMGGESGSDGGGTGSMDGESGSAGNSSGSMGGGSGSMSGGSGSAEGSSSPTETTNQRNRHAER